MMKRVKKWEELVGKTIKNFDEVDEGIALTFDDGTYAYIESGPAWDGDRAMPELKELDGPNVMPIIPDTARRLAQLGIWDNDEYVGWKAEIEKRVAANEAEKERKERETLANLKAKYERSP